MGRGACLCESAIGAADERPLALSLSVRSLDVRLDDDVNAIPIGDGIRATLSKSWVTVSQGVRQTKREKDLPLMAAMR